MIAFRTLENTYIDSLIGALQEGRLKVGDFSGESKSHIKGHIYNELKLNEIYTTHPAKVELKERMRRCATQYPYFAVREGLVRSHYLSIIFNHLSGQLKSSPRQAARFLQGKNLSHARIKRLSSILDKDVFGTQVSLSFFYIQNLVGQARNLFLATSSLESALRTRIQELLTESEQIRNFIDLILSSFTRKRNGKKKALPAGEVLQYFFARYMAQVKRKSTWHAKHVEPGLNVESFKREREKRFAPLEISLKKYVDGLDRKCMGELVREVIHKVLHKWLNLESGALVKNVFKPVSHAPHIGLEPSRTGFIHYFTQVLTNQVRRNISGLFLTRSLLKDITSALTHIKTDLPALVPPPRIKGLAVPLNQEEGVYEPEYNRLTVKMSFLSRDWVELDINDEKGRISELLDEGATPCLPVITMKGRKILLHLPLEYTSSDLSNQSSAQSDLPEKRIEIGVDLGLKYPAVLSVMDRSEPAHPVEIARYFLSMRTLLDMRFNPRSGRFEKKGRFSNPHSNTQSTIKQSLRSVRREARNLQRKVHEYENRFKKRTGKKPKNKYKYYRLQRDVARVWERIHHMNRELVRQIQHAIVAIATFHGAQVLKFENLRWSRHSRKKETGRWLSFWQVHWFFSQVQNAVEVQATFKGIRFRRVRAEYTSQTCWECHARGSRVGRSFSCTNAKQHASGKPIRLHADLNAARVIALS